MRLQAATTVTMTASTRWLLLYFLFHYCFNVVTARQQKTCLTWINGIGYSAEHMQVEQAEISRLFGQEKVLFCHNPTGMAHEEDLLGWVGDFAQAGSQKIGIITAEVDLLVKHLRQAVAMVGDHGRVVHIAHSQGALITYLASKKLLPVELNRIEVLSFGGAAALRKAPATPFYRCINYYAVNDPLLWVVPSAAQALRSGFSLGENDEFCFLAPRAGDPLVDHKLLGPTYRQALVWEGARFQREYQSSLYRTSVSTKQTLLRLALALDTRVATVLKSVLRPYVEWCIRLYATNRRIFNQSMLFWRQKVVRPIILLALLIWEYTSDLLRVFKGEEKFVPINTELLLPEPTLSSPTPLQEEAEVVINSNATVAAAATTTQNEEA